MGCLGFPFLLTLYAQDGQWRVSGRALSHSSIASKFFGKQYVVLHCSFSNGGLHSAAVPPLAIVLATQIGSSETELRKGLGEQLQGLDAKVRSSSALVILYRTGNFALCVQKKVCNAPDTLRDVAQMTDFRKSKCLSHCEFIGSAVVSL